MTTCYWNHDRKCTADEIDIDKDWQDKPKCYSYQKEVGYEVSDV
jgi:hypothetical protein